MSHEIETMMYVGETPWHGLGVYVGEETIDSRTAIIKAGLDWEVKLKDVLFKNENEEIIEVNNQKVIFRTTDDKPFSVVSNRYTPVQNKDAFIFMDSLVSEGLMKYHTAGSLRGGKNIWILGKIGSTEIVPNDQVDNYILLYNSHDGNSSLKCFFTAVRVVCANTANIALARSKKTGIAIKHTSNILSHVTEAKAVLNIATSEFNNFETFSKRLASLQVNTEIVTNFTKILFPEPVEEIESTRYLNNRLKFIELFENGIGQDIPNVAGTGWAMYNALVEFSNYHLPVRGNKREKRFEQSIINSNNIIMTSGMNQLYQMAA